jgi:membrane-associated PAP2 superfamily phosphatase
MNRIALAIALGVGIVVGVIFGVYPQLDLKLAALFYDPSTNGFIAVGDWVIYVRDAATLLITLLVAPALFAIVGKLIMPQRRMLIPGRAALFLSVSLVVGPFLVTNVILKDHWARMRPADMVQFGGNEQITAWWDPTGPCPDNCSFIAGEPSAAFWTFAPASFAPPQWRPLAYAGVLIFAAAMGVLRMASGAHFFSDVVFAGVFMFLVVWTLHGLIYRWRPTRLTDEAAERPLERAGNGLRAALARLTGRKNQRP